MELFAIIPRDSFNSAVIDAAGRVVRVNICVDGKEGGVIVRLVDSKASS